MEGREHVPESVARMQAKAAQLAEELHLSQLDSQSMTSSSAALGGEPGFGAAGCTGGSLLQHTGGTSPPAVFRRLSHANAAAVKPPGATRCAPQSTMLHCQQLEAELQLWKCKHADAAKELDRRQESYMRREEQLKQQLAALTQVQDAGDSIGRSSDDSSSCQAGDPAVGSQPAVSSSRALKVQKPLTLQEMQEQVLAGLDDLLQRQKLQMRTEEAQQLRQFRGLLAEIEGQLQASKQAAAAHQGDWMDKTVSLREELARSQEITSKLDSMYKLAEEEAAAARLQFKAQEDDRQHLVRQLIAVKQENSRLRQEASSLQGELDAITALALEAEAGRPPDAAEHLWGSAALQEAGARPSTSDSSLAAAINDMVTRRGSSGSSGSAQLAGSARSGGGRVRPLTAGAGRQRSQPAAQHVRPWSAAAQQQRSQPPSSAEPPGQGVPGDLAAVQAKMERYSHVIQQLKKLLESERRQLRQARSCYTAELGRRTELQGLLLSSIQQAKQEHRAAEAAANAQQRQHQQPQLLPWAAPRPGSSATRSRPASCRPVSGHSVTAAHPGSSQLLGSGRQQGGSRPSSAVAQAADGQQPQLSAPAWEQLLEQLLVRRDVLDHLFNRAFPDLVEASLGQLGGSRQAPDATQLGERWAACQQQEQQQQQLQQHQQQQHEQQRYQQQLQGARHQQGAQQFGLGETSPREAGLAGVALDEGLQGSDSDCDSSRMDSGSVAHDAAAEAAFSGTAGADDGDSHAWDEHQQQQEQQVASSVQQQPAEVTRVTLGGLSSPVMPRFPVRQPLHHTVVQRPRSGVVQHQPDPDGATRRPASAAAGSLSAQLQCAQSLVRPATAACRQEGALGPQQQQQQQLLRPTERSAAARSSVLTGASQRPGTSSSHRELGGGLPQAGRPVSAAAAVSKRAWAADAAVITGSFLASS